MSNLLALVLWNPFKTLRFGYTFAVQILLIVLRRILLPHYPHYQTLRLQLQRAYLASTNLHFPDLVHRLPVRRCPETRARKVTTSSWTGYFVPGSASAKEIALDCSAAPPTQRRNCVVLYAHGGGYARGEARMYLNYMERWIARGAEAGLDVAFLSVEYPLTTDAPHPAQRDAFLGAYRYLLDQGVPASRIVFMGDSAGGGLALLCGVEVLRRGLPSPAASVLVSPWIDMTLRAYNGGNALIETDYVVTGNSLVPVLTSMWLGGRPGDSPEVNPLCCTPEDIRGLNPLLILAGGGEFLVEDSRDLADLCRRAGVRHELVVEWGHLHIYAMGGRWIDPAICRKTDDKILGWINEFVV